jgi:hypothetical protein
MNLYDEFKASEMYSKLGQRANTMAYMIAHLERAAKGLIVETGTARIEGNWSGDGQSTLVWDWAASHLPYRVKSVDINPEFVETAKKQVHHTEVVLSDSIRFLSSLSNADLADIKLLYLDSYDWRPSMALDCMFHHMAELAAVWAKLPSGCMVVVDDRHSETEGKHFMVAVFMNKLGIAPVFSDYQIGWIKP